MQKIVIFYLHINNKVLIDYFILFIDFVWKEYQNFVIKLMKSVKKHPILEFYYELMVFPWNICIKFRKIFEFSIIYLLEINAGYLIINIS